MGAIHSKKRQKHGVESLNVERKEENSNGYGRKEESLNASGDGYGRLRMEAKLIWSKVKNFLNEYKLSCKLAGANSKKRSSRKVEGEILPEKIKNTREVLRVIEDRNVLHAVNVKDVEQLAKRRWKAPPGGEDKVVLYFTSLRVIRKTFDNCYAVKLILAGFRVLVDERDISMHASFRQELQDLLGMPITVPSLFIAGKYIGGIEEIQELHEGGELAKYFEGFPLRTCSTRPCHGCGDARFVPCLNCDGSRKVFIEDMGGQPRGQFIRCLECNENGLIKCPLCCC